MPKTEALAILLTNNGEIIPEAAGLRVPEVDAASVDALVVAPHVLDDELRRFRHRPEVGPRAEHFRRGPVSGLAQRLAPNVEAETATKKKCISHCSSDYNPDINIAEYIVVFVF